MTARDESEYWDNQLIEQRRTALKTFRDVASKWQGTIAGLLGLFSTAAVIKGPGTFKELGIPNEEDAIQLLVLIAMVAIVAFVAVLCSARAAQGIPTIRHHWTGDQLREWTQNEVRATLRWLLYGRLLTFVAATWLLIAWLFVPLAYITGPAPTLKAVIIRADGMSLCGILKNPGALTLTVAGVASPIALRADDQLTIVERCPKQ